MKKQFIAKLLVLCMVLSMLPMAVFAEISQAPTGGTAENGSYSITADVTGTGSGKVLVYYNNNDTILTGANEVYVTANDAVTIKVEADAGSTVSSSSYTMGGTTETFTGEKLVYHVTDDIVVYAVFTANQTIQPQDPPPISSGGSSSSGGHGGVSSGSSNQVTVQAPATSGGATTVNILVQTTSTTVTVSQKDMDKAVDDVVKAAAAAGTAPKLVINVTTSDNASSIRVNLPASSLQTLAKVEGATLSITSNVAGVELDSAATTALADQATSGTVSFSVTQTSASSLTSAQQQAVKGATVIDVSITAGGKQITDFGNGTLSVSVAYTLPSGVSAADVQVFYLTNSGALEACETSFSRGVVTFTTTHLSKYVIGTKDMGGVSFTDVVIGSYYYDAVAWAVENNITNGISATLFGPDNACTRAQIVTFLWRSAGSPEPASSVNPFTDVASSAYYYKAVLWAVEKGITTGMSETTFAPDATCTRAQAVTFLYRAKGSPAASGSVGSFNDVSESAYYANAVAWAVKANVTTGTSATTFSPDNNCTRAQIVTFLYRSQVTA